MFLIIEINLQPIVCVGIRLTLLRISVCHIKVPWYLLYPDSSTDKSEIMNDINSFYESIVSVLLSAAESSVPKRKSNYYKFWWDIQLDLLKKESIEKQSLVQPVFLRCVEVSYQG